MNSPISATEPFQIRLSTLASQASDLVHPEIGPDGAEAAQCPFSSQKNNGTRSTKEKHGLRRNMLLSLVNMELLGRTRIMTMMHRSRLKGTLSETVLGLHATREECMIGGEDHRCQGKAMSA